MNLEKVVFGFFGFFVLLAATLNFGFFIGDIDDPQLPRSRAAARHRAAGAGWSAGTGGWVRS